MIPMTCDQVAEQIDLHAAAECDAPTAGTIDRHLADCPSCTEKYAAARQLLGLLDLRLREPDLRRRLQARVQAEALRRRRRATVLPFVRRFSAVAALVLLTFGLTNRLGPPLASDSEDVSTPVVARLLPLRRFALAPDHPAVPEAVRAAKEEDLLAMKKEDAPSRTLTVQALKASGATLREQLRAGLATGRLPPPQVDLELTFFNRGPGDLTLSLDERTEVEIDLQGPRVVTLPAAAVPPRLPIPEQTLRLPAGQGRAVPLTRLTSVSPRGTFYSYWTEPGEYELRVRLRAEALFEMAGARHRPVLVTVTSQPITVQVVGKP
jgi:hypothetical protein